MVRKSVISGQRIAPEKLAFAKKLRREMTPAEAILWEHVRGSQLGLHFRRQQIIDGFIADFFCDRASVVVEVDGDVHDTQQQHDHARSEVFRARGLRVLRLRNEDIFHDVEAVLRRLAHFCGIPRA